LATLLKELAERGQALYGNHTSMAIAKFEELLHMVRSKVQNTDTNSDERGADIAIPT
jgi:hypothetical protein